MRALGFLAMLAAQSGPGIADAQQGLYYECSVERSGPTGKVAIRALVNPGGSRAPDHVSWTMAPVPGRLVSFSAFWIDFDGRSPDGDDTAWIRMRSGLERPTKVRIEIWRGSRPQFRYMVAFASQFGRSSGEFSLQIPWDALKAFARDAPSLTGAVVDRSGKVIVQEEVDPALFEAVEREVRAARGALAELVEHRRDRCFAFRQDH